MKYILLTPLALLLAGCGPSDAEWSARAAMARADSAAQAAEANARASEAAARASEAVARSQASVQTTEIWAVALPGILLLLAVLILAVVGLWLWNKHSQRQAELERARLQAMMQMLAAPPPQQRRQLAPPQEYIDVGAGHWLPVREDRQRSKWMLGPDEIPACRRPLPQLTDGRRDR